MKKVILIFCLICLALPSFATGLYYEGCNDNVTYYGNTKAQELYEKLDKEYQEKYIKQVSPTEYVDTAKIGTYTRDVTIPVYKFMIEEDRRENNWEKFQKLDEQIYQKKVKEYNEYQAKNKK